MNVLRKVAKYGAWCWVFDGVLAAFNNSIEWVIFSGLIAGGLFFLSQWDGGIREHRFRDYRRDDG